MISNSVSQLIKLLLVHFCSNSKNVCTDCGETSYCQYGEVSEVIILEDQISEDIHQFPSSLLRAAYFNSESIFTLGTGSTNESKLVFVVPSNVSFATDMIEQIGSFYNWARSQLVGVWKPVFILIWPDATTTDEYSDLIDFTSTSPLDSDLYIVFKNETITSPSQFLFWMIELYSNKDISRAEMINLNRIRDSSDFEFYDVLSKCFNRQNFKGAPVKAVEMYDPLPQFARHITIDNGTVTYIGGYDVELFWFLRDALNFTAVEMQASGWISSDGKGNLLGMAGQIVNEEADISIACTVPYSEDELSFLHPVQTASLYAFFEKPQMSAIVTNIFSQPFDAFVWLATAGLLLLLTFAIIALARLRQLSVELTESVEEISEYEYLYWAVTLLCLQGWHIPPLEFVSFKIVFLCGLVTTFILHTAYSAFLISFLSIDMNPIKSFKEVLNHRYTITASGYVDSANYSIQEEIQNSPKLKVKQAFDRTDATIGIERILTSTTAFVGIAEEYFKVSQDSREKKKFQEKEILKVRVGSISTKAASFVKRGTPFQEFFNYKILLMFENGLRFRLMQNYAKGMGMSSQGESALMYNYRSIEMTDVVMPFGVLLVGVVVTPVLIWVEKLFSLRRTKTSLKLIPTIQIDKETHYWQT